MFCHKCPDAHNCSTTEVDPTPCNIGWYSNLENSTCTECSKGNYCPLTKHIQIPCPAGYYQDSVAQTACIICQEGYGCGNSGMTPCPPGTFSDYGMHTCDPCPNGHYCPGGVGVKPIPATPGLQCSTGKAAEGNCIQCPAGSMCPTPHPIDETPCPTTPGYAGYSPGGLPYCPMCPPGEGCDPPSLNTTCPGNKYSPPGYGPCMDCPAGYACPQQGHGNYTMQCPFFAYSVLGDNNCNPAPPGTQVLDRGLDASICPDGQYSTGMWDMCQDCSPGHSCEPHEGPRLCTQGSSSIGGLRYCPGLGGNYEAWDKGTAKVQCQTGYHSPLLSGGPAGYGEGWCRPCPNGMDCQTDGIPAPCAEGTYSPSGQLDCLSCAGAVGTICPVGTGYPIPCPPGLEVTTPGLCNPCSVPGQYSIGAADTCTDCPAGQYCPEMHMYPTMCPKGHYSSINSVACTKCDDGYICEPGSTVSTSRPCPKGHYCIHVTQLEGSFYREQVLPCPAGTYNNAEGLGTICTTPCTLGYFCPPGTADPSLDRIYKCPKGYYCPSGTQYATQYPCPAGTYNPNLMGSIAPPAGGGNSCPTCSVGYYCPEASPKQLNCPNGYTCPSNSGDLPSLVSGGSVCAAGTFNIELRSAVCSPCPLGYYCEQGAASPTYCPVYIYIYII